MPAPDTEVKRRWCVATKRLSGDGGRVAELEAVRVRWVPSANGPVMDEMPGSEFRVKADLALLALGYDPVIDEALAAQLGLATGDGGTIAVKDHATDVEGVFAAGDLVTGASYVVTAIDSGRNAAERIHAYLTRLPRG